MSLEKRLKTIEDVELVEIWMGAPEGAKPVLPERLLKYMERLKLAYRWLEDHGSPKIVRNMMIAHFRTQEHNYSLKTAIRDVDDAMRLYRTASPNSTRFFTEMMLNNLIERSFSAARAGKDKEYAAIAKVVLEYIKELKQQLLAEAARVTEPIPIIGTFDLKEAGLIRQPGLEERIQEFLKDFEQRKKSGFRASGDSAIDADFTEEPDPS